MWGWVVGRSVDEDKLNIKPRLAVVVRVSFKAKCGKYAHILAFDPFSVTGDPFTVNHLNFDPFTVKDR